MIKEDVPIDEVNCGEGYWNFFHAEKTLTVLSALHLLENFNSKSH